MNKSAGTFSRIHCHSAAAPKSHPQQADFYDNRSSARLTQGKLEEA